MKKTKINHIIEYSSASLIISYFYIHNIFLVLVGITFSLYLININFINSLIKSISMTLIIKNISKDSIKNDLLNKSISINTESTKEGKKLTLVETIEELGFIPSIDKNDKNNVA